MFHSETPLIKLWLYDPHIAKVVWVVSILIIIIDRMELLYNLCHCWRGVWIEALAASQESLIDLFNSGAMCGSVNIQDNLLPDFSIDQV